MAAAAERLPLASTARTFFFLQRANLKPRVVWKRGDSGAPHLRPTPSLPCSALEAQGRGVVENAALARRSPYSSASCAPLEQRHPKALKIPGTSSPGSRVTLVRMLVLMPLLQGSEGLHLVGSRPPHPRTPLAPRPVLPALARPRRRPW